MATINRRKFMAGVATAVTMGAAAAESADRGASKTDSTPQLDLKTATAATFRAVIGQTFKIGTAKLVLQYVSVFDDPNRNKRPAGVRLESFSLLFSAPLNFQQSPGIYTLGNSTTGDISVYMNQVKLPSTFSTNSVLGQAERFLKTTGQNLDNTEPKSWYEAPFN